MGKHRARPCDWGLAARGTCPLYVAHVERAQGVRRVALPPIASFGRPHNTQDAKCGGRVARACRQAMIEVMATIDNKEAHRTVRARALIT